MSTTRIKPALLSNPWCTIAFIATTFQTEDSSEPINRGVQLSISSEHYNLIKINEGGYTPIETTFVVHPNIGHVNAKDGVVNVPWDQANVAPDEQTIIVEFTNKFLGSMRDIEPDISKAVQKRFWDML